METITLNELKNILNRTPKQTIEEECNVWGCCTPHYKKVLTEEDVIYETEKYLKERNEKIKSI